MTDNIKREEEVAPILPTVPIKEQELPEENLVLHSNNTAPVVELEVGNLGQAEALVPQQAVVQICQIQLSMYRFTCLYQLPHNHRKCIRYP